MAVEAANQPSAQRKGLRRTALAPLLDRRGNFSLLKSVTFGCLFIPAFQMAYEWHAVAGLAIIPEETLIYDTGVWSTWFLLAALAVTPLRRITGWSQLVSVRRMIGLAGLAYALAHLPIYFALRLWDPARIFTEVPQRVTLIVATLSLIGLVVLGATSVDAAIRWMGERWNQLHNWVYVLTGLAILHVLLSSASLDALPYMTAGVFAWLMAWRVLDRYRLAANVRALLVLAASTALFTLVLEALWIWISQMIRRAFFQPPGGFPARRPPPGFFPNWWEQIGLAPALTVLAVGLLAVGLAAAQGQVNDHGRRIGAALKRAVRAPVALATAGIGIGVWSAYMLLPPAAPFDMSELDGLFGETFAIAEEPGGDVERLLPVLGGAAAGGMAGFVFGMAIDRGSRRRGLAGGLAEAPL